MFHAGISQCAPRRKGLILTSETVQSKGTILVVDDEAELRFVLAAHLRAAGFNVLEATDGYNAIKITTEQRPDIIILDIGLPGMDGIQVTQAIKRDPRVAAIPIIMLTARSSTADVVRGLEAGAHEYLPKPFDVAELMARVQTMQRLVDARKNVDELNSRLEAEVNAKTRRLRLLYEFMRDLNHADTQDRILDLLVECIRNTTGAQRISVFLTDDKGDKLVCRRAIGIDPEMAEQLQVRDAEGITGQVFRSGRMLSARAHPATQAESSTYHREAFISTPLISTNLKTSTGTVGVLNVTEKSDDSDFTEEEMQCIRSVADAAAIALTNVVRQGRLQESVKVLLRTVGHLAEYRDEETTQHLERVSRLARILGQELQRSGPYASIFTNEFINKLVQAAPMHDIGKVGIPDEILTKPGQLTRQEFEVMKMHTEIGREVLSQALDPANPVPLLQMCIDIAYCHHERFDGGGYPRGLRGLQIPLAARVIALVDAYDAMTSRRRYKEAKSHQQVVKIIRAESGRHFDPAIVEAFLRCQNEFDSVRSQLGEPNELVGAGAI
jgi:response regulator RpfG family c-di-GMP phosphodiesterase